MTAFDLVLRNARLAGRPMPVCIGVRDGVIAAISADPPGPGAIELDAGGDLVRAPYVESHLHLDATLTAGQPRWNHSGTLWEGIALWGERRATLTREDVTERAEELLRWLAACGVLFVRTHVDVCDPRLVALESLLELRERVADVIEVQIVAFPQDGALAFPHGMELVEEALRLGADAVGGIPHNEETREDGVESLHRLFELAVRHERMVDIHCDETDDDHSRFIEVVVALAHRSGLRERVAASHTTAMGSYNSAYAEKLIRRIAASGACVIANPLVNLNLQGRTDGYPKRRGLTRVRELLDAGVDVALGHDDVMDPWYPLGIGNPLHVALVGAHALHMTAPAQVTELLAMVSDRAARVLGLGERYGIGVGRPASFIVLPALDAFDVVRRQVAPRWVVSRGHVLVEHQPSAPVLSWPGEAERGVTFELPGDRPYAGGQP